MNRRLGYLPYPSVGDSEFEAPLLLLVMYSFSAYRPFYPQRGKEVAQIYLPICSSDLKSQPLRSDRADDAPQCRSIAT